MPRKVITFSDSQYFQYGKFFLQTRRKIKADFILYGPDLTDKQKNTLKQHNIQYKPIDADDFKNKMQFLKFHLISQEIDQEDNRGITFVDFDTFFIRDWRGIFKREFDLGITIRNDSVKKRMLRAYANGGVIFGKQNSQTKGICEFAQQTMLHGGHKALPEYNKIYKTLEHNRPVHKTYKREDLSWWVDQVLLSSLILHHFSNKQVKKVSDMHFFKFKKYQIGLFNCDLYNNLNCRSLNVMKKSFICHMKDKGRPDMKNIEGLLEKIK